jgi:hypothetical protein
MLDAALRAFYLFVTVVKATAKLKLFTAFLAFIFINRHTSPPYDKVTDWFDKSPILIIDDY